MKRLIKQNILKFSISLYRTLFARKIFFNFNKLMYTLSLRGMGVLNFENDNLSGENLFLKKVSVICNNSVIVDVGANIGCYSNKARSFTSSANIYAFEPHPQTFKKLQYEANQHKYIALNTACSDESGTLKLYDYEDSDNGSSHASLHRAVIETIHKGASKSLEVNVTTIDEFMKDYKISNIRLLKIDTEGNELKVLKGAKQAISEQLIDIIHFEFNEMNVISKVFFKDFKDILINYSFYRLLPDALLDISEYSPIYCEVFAYQNIIAINKSFLPQVKKYFNF
ncbi:FkbM family methyltransferase [Brunnivagina elsteri]|uniref:FkbM family methyltransferase n=1 Tax=Brunnivagina elsteri CCALA 953 TaxID=987040 RepID=A0A2A2TNS4_9CYAN|nr:FkbM family methyltransferase [Calothrix elsteri]PAX60057.1 FkbM family methyltransferase [Calothrix elsteri CCALA 953]